MIGLRKLYRASTQVGFRIVEQGLQMWHKMIPDTWTGSNRLPDSSPNSNTAALYTGRGLSFDGVNDSVNIGNVPELDFERTDSFSFSCYFSCNNRSGSDFLLGKYFAPKGYGVFVNSLTGGISILIRNSVSLNEIFITTNVQNLDDGILRHLVVTYDGSSDASNIRIYINGVASAITIISNNLSQTINNTGSFNLGTTGSSQYLSGRLSNVKVFDIELTSSQVAELYANPEQVLPTGVTESNLVGWWPLADGTAAGIALDGSGNGNHGTIAGATVSFALPSPVSQVALKGNNQPMWFDGIADYISTGSKLIGGNTSFSVVAWVMISGSSFRCIYAAPDGENGEPPFLFRVLDTGKLGGFVKTTASAVTAGSTTLSHNRLYHVACVYNGTDIRLYVDGVLDNSPESQTGMIYNGSTNDTIGVWDKAGLIQFFEKIVFSIGVFDSALTSTEISQIYNNGDIYFDLTADSGNYTSSANLQGYWKNTGNTDADWVDLSGNGNDGTVNGSPGTIYLPEGLTAGKDILGADLNNPNNGEELVLDGAGYAEVADNNSLDFGTGDFTVECWAKGNYVNRGSTSNIILAKSTAGPTANFYLSTNSTNKMFFAVGSDIVSSTSTINKDEWYHITGVRNAGVLYLYINGVLEGTPIANVDNITNGTSLFIGKDSTANRMWGDYIDDVRVYNRALTSNKILRNYNSGKSKHKN